MAMNASVARGSCLCGAVRFRAQLPTKWVAHCHCTYCRRAHGAAFVTWAGFRSEQFALEPGSAQPVWHASSRGARRGFCGTCGSPMLFESSRWPGETHVARSLFSDPLDKSPSVHVFYESHVPWLQVDDGLPRKVSQVQPAGTAPTEAGMAATGPVDAKAQRSMDLDRLLIRPATKADATVLQAIRAAAFAPIFSAFQEVMGEVVYDLVQRRDDAAQATLLASLLEDDADRRVHVAMLDGVAAGFVAVILNRETQVGEIGLNAVAPDVAGRGIGTAMYEFALARMRQAGMRAAVVSTGGDASHAPARAAYRKAGLAIEFPSVFFCREL
jgi:GNAT superfamily N-acetyltransferase